MDMWVYRKRMDEKCSDERMVRIESSQLGK